MHGECSYLIPGKDSTQSPLQIAKFYTEFFNKLTISTTHFYCEEQDNTIYLPSNLQIRYVQVNITAHRL